MTTQVERLARLEERVSALEDKIDKMDGKIDDLLALKYKGAGVFWLASILMGTGFFSLFSYFFGGK